MSDPTPPDDAPALDTCGGEDLLAEVTDDFLRRHRAGQRPSIEEYAGRHPELAARIRELFPALIAMEHAGVSTPLDFAPASDRVGATIGRYKLLERIGEGGFGVVYMAEQLTPVRRKVALKVIKPGYDTRQVIARFEAERQALALMDHENIAKVLDAGATDSGRPYFVMELVHGVPITDYCDRNELAPRERLELFVQVCRAVQHAHTKGIIHRDIKPTNVLVTLHEGIAVPKVIDFGVAKATGQQLTEKTLFTNFAQMVGTPLYMSPEQAEMTSVDVDTRSDVYSLGVLLYELLTGTTPLDKDRLKQSAFDEVRRIIREEEPPRPSTRLSTLAGDQARTISSRRKSDPAQLGRLIRGELDWIVMKSLEKDRRRRYETANGLVRDIERYLNNDPVEACPPSAAYRLRKFAGRNRVALAISALVTVGLLGLMTTLAVSNVLIRRHSQAREVALESARAQEAAAVRERQRAEHESQLARHAGAQSEARLFLQQRRLPVAIERANEAYRLGGQWEDGLLLHEIAAAARRNWTLTARISVPELPSTSCMVAAAPGPWLVVCIRDVLRVFDARTGKPLGMAAAAHHPHQLFPTTQRDAAVLAVSDSDVALLSLPGLACQTSRSFSDPITEASLSGSYLLLVHRSGTVQIVKLPDFSDVDSFVWNQTEATRQLPLPYPNQTTVSPDGKLAFMHGGRWWQDAVLWDRRAGATAFTLHHLRSQRFQFIDNTRLIGWFSAGEPNEMHLYAFGLPPSTTTQSATTLSATMPSEAKARTATTRSAHVWWQGFLDDTIMRQVAFQAWTGNTSTRVAMVGVSGLVISYFTSDLNRISDRFDNLMPGEPVPKFVALDGPSGALALANEKQLLLFARQPESDNFNTDDYCATACRDGLLHAWWNRSTQPRNAGIQLTPFDARRAPVIFNPQWPADSVWVPWAIAATRDGATIAMLAQESDDSDSSGARYGRVRALIYHPHSLADGGAWKLDQAFELNAPPGVGARFASLDPDARALVYWHEGAVSVSRYDPRDGRLLGEMEVGPFAARSPDGARVASVINDGRRLRVYEIATGRTLLDLPVESSSDLCFTADGSGIVARQGKFLVTYAIDSGEVVSSVSANLRPLAALPSANRLLAYQRDDTGEGGAIVLADSSTGKIVDILTRANPPDIPAFFSESGRELAILTDRWSAQVMRSLRPEELAGALDARFGSQEAAAALPPVKIVTTAPLRTSLPTTQESHDAIDPLTLAPERAPIGQTVTIQGRVGRVSSTQAHNAINIEFAGDDPQGLLVWVPPDVYGPLAKAFGQNPASTLQGRTILVRGRLDLYGGHRPEWKDRLQVTADLHQIWIVADGEASATTHPATTNP